MYVIAQALTILGLIMGCGLIAGLLGGAYLGLVVPLY